MQKDEVDLLPFWLHYHGSLFGYRNLYVYDNGSAPPALDILERARRQYGINVDYSQSAPADFEGKGRLFASRISKWALKKRAHFYFPLDCDEFVGVQINSLFSCRPEDIKKQLKRLRPTRTKAFKVTSRLDNSWHDPHTFYTPPRAGKLFFGNTKLRWLSMGFHSSHGPAEVSPSPVVYFHFHFKPYGLLQEHAQQKLKLRLDLNNASLTDLQGYKGRGHHLARHLSRTEREIDTWLRSLPSVSTSAISDRFNELGIGFPFRTALAHHQKAPCSKST
jgi:hypothetical protein